MWWKGIDQIQSQTLQKVSVFEVILVGIFPHSDWITPNIDTWRSEVWRNVFCSNEDEIWAAVVYVKSSVIEAWQVMFTYILHASVKGWVFSVRKGCFNKIYFFDIILNEIHHDFIMYLLVKHFPFRVPLQFLLRKVLSKMKTYVSPFLNSSLMRLL